MLKMRSLDAAWEADPRSPAGRGRCPGLSPGPFARRRSLRRDFELGLALGSKMKLAVRSELHEATPT